MCRVWTNKITQQCLGPAPGASQAGAAAFLVALQTAFTPSFQCFAVLKFVLVVDQARKAHCAPAG